MRLANGWRIVERSDGAPATVTASPQNDVPLFATGDGLNQGKTEAIRNDEVTSEHACGRGHIGYMLQRFRCEFACHWHTLWHTLALVSVVALAAVLRLYHLASLPNGFNQDEAANGYDAYAIAHTWRDHHGQFLPILLQSFGDWVSPTLTYLTAPFVRVLGVTVYATRLPVALFGVLTVLLAHVYVVQLTKQKSLGVLAALLLAVMPWAVTLSRWAIPPSIVPFFVLLALVTFYWAKSDDSRRRYWKSGAFIVVAIGLTYAYPSEKVFAPILVLTLCAIFLLQKQKFGQLLFVLMSYTVGVAPLYWLAFLDPARYNARFDSVSLFGHYRSLNAILIQATSRYVQYFSPDFNFGLGDMDPAHHVPGAPSSYSFLAPLFYCGILCSMFVIGRRLLGKEPSRVALSSRLSWRDHAVLLAWLVASPLAACVTIDREHVLRVVQYLPLVTIYALVGLSVIQSALVVLTRPMTAAVTRVLTRAATYVVLLGALAPGFSGFAVAYYQQYPHTSEGVFQHDVDKAIDYAVAHQGGYDHIYVDASIDQPYIYYLVFSAYDPNNIDYVQLNASSGSHLGKYVFVSLSTLPAGATRVYTVQDGGTVWYVLAARGASLYVQRVH